MKKTRRKMARLAKRGTDVVAVDLPNGATEFSVNPKMAAMLSADVATEIIETKDLTTDELKSAPLWSCDSCKRPAGKAADGKVVVLYPFNGQLICIGCAGERHAKEIAEAETKAARAEHHIRPMGESTVPIRAAAARVHALRVGEELPSELARRKAKQKRRLGVPESYQPKAIDQGTLVEKAIMDHIVTTLGAIVAYVETGMPITGEVKAALDGLANAIKGQALSDTDTKAALEIIARVRARFTKTSAPTTPVPPVLNSWADFVRAQDAQLAAIPRAPTARQIVDQKFVPIASREAKTDLVVAAMFDQSFVPTGLSSIEQVEYQLERAYKTANSPPFIRKFRAV